MIRAQVSARSDFRLLTPGPEIAVEQPAGTNLTDGSGTVDFGAVDLGASHARTFVTPAAHVPRLGLRTCRPGCLARQGPDCGRLAKRSLCDDHRLAAPVGTQTTGLHCSGSARVADRGRLVLGRSDAGRRCPQCGGDEVGFLDQARCGGLGDGPLGTHLQLRGFLARPGICLDRVVVSPWQELQRRPRDADADGQRLSSGRGLESKTEKPLLGTQNPGRRSNGDEGSVGRVGLLHYGCALGFPARWSQGG